MIETSDRHTEALENYSARELENNFIIFNQLLTLGHALLQQRRYTTVAFIAHIAGMYAWHNHPGLFASSKLEQLLLHLGHKAIPRQHYPKSTTAHTTVKPQHVLHVFTVAYGTGGHTRLAWRWIERDTTRKHSVVITSQFIRRVPEQLLAAAESSGGTIYKLDSSDGSFLGRARRLREIGATADSIVLHVHPFDIIPLIAFAPSDQRPPTLLMNHAEHLFWLGVGIADTVAHYREAGKELAHSRRGLATERSVLLPLPLTLPQRTLTRAEAKAALDITQDTVVILSIASAYKYVPINKTSFIDVHVALLREYPQAILLVIGPEQEGEWRAAYSATGGRLRALGVREDVQPYFQAADIYVDSFPLGGLTALLEAGGYGTPLVAYCMRPDGALLLCADDPAWPIEQVRVRSIRRYHEVVAQLIREPNLRTVQGERIRASITAIHSDTGWLEFLNSSYMHTLESQHAQPPAVNEDTASLAVIDRELVTSQPFWMRHYSFNLGRRPIAQQLPPLLQTAIWFGIFTWNFSREVIDLIIREISPRISKIQTTLLRKKQR